ncbi:hypothetical protein [Terricaulis sp.]|uniref:hypothetical protein n=1 Tax=Terricaulis sp. TaxID=2768686 RepID=UPI002AC64B5D|nr:hypothetical protein [Terricaulis sp.]MDZ4693423.1 hypothetical protein [Terricaulis sp.]
MTASTGVPSWLTDVAIPIGTFVLGFLISHFTLSKRDRKDIEQTNYENTERLIEQHKAAFERYCSVLKAYDDAEEPTFDHFYAIATAGEAYFYQARLMADAVLSEKVDTQIRDSTLMPKLKEMTNKTLPLHYSVLQSIAKKKEFEYHGELRRSDYESIYSAVERFSIGP